MDLPQLRMSPLRQRVLSQVWRYLGALCASLLALALALALVRLATLTPFIIFAVAVLGSAFYGGVGPGLFATVLSLLALDYFVFPPRFAFGPTDNLSALGGYLLVCLLINGFALALRRSQATARRYKILAESIVLHSPVGITIQDPDDGRILLANPRHAERQGRTAQEMIGARLRDFYPPALVARWQDQDREIVRTREALRSEELVEEEAGDVRTYFSIKFPLIGPDGQVFAVGGFFEDITRRKQLERQLHAQLAELARRQLVTEGLQEILAAINSARPLAAILTHLLQQATRILGLDAGAVYRVQHGDADQPGAWLTIEAGYGLPAGLAGLRVPLGYGATGQAVAQRIPIHDYTPDPSAPSAAPLDEDARQLIAAVEAQFPCVLAVPLLLQGTVYGALTMYAAEPRPLPDETVELALTIATQVALTIENSLLQQQAVSAERARLARELHDSVTQLLYSVTLMANGGRTRLLSGQLSAAEQDDLLGQLHTIGQQALAEMRLLIHQLRSPLLDQLGLAGALQQRLEGVERRAGLRTRLHVAGEPSLAPTIEAQLFQIAQEALNNCLRHAQATAVDVRVEAEAERLCLTVQDDGVGFDRATTGAGVGLVSMQERATLIDGVLTISSAPGQGTTVTVCVATTARPAPIDAASAAAQTSQ